LSFHSSRSPAIPPWDWLRSPTRPPENGPGDLTWHPSEIDACLAARSNQRIATLEEEELAELREAHRRWGADDASLDSIEELAKPDVRVVVTGQQPALLAGPLLVIYKTIGAIALCRQLAARHPDLRFVPVFWVASEDHDFDEVRSATWLTNQGGLHSFALEATPGRAGRMAGSLAAADAADPLMNSIRETTFDTEYKEAALDLIRRSFAEPGDLETAFCRLLLRLTRGTGLMIVSPLMTWLRRRAAPILQADLARAGEASRVVNERGEEQRHAGLEPALKRPAFSLNFFYIDDERRRWQLRLDADDDALVVAAPAGGFDAAPRSFERDALAAMLADDPTRFSANVVTRPLVQDAALPTVAQTIGPGEAAYLSQVEAVYADFGVAAPVRWPRPRAVLLEPRLERRLAKHQLRPEQAADRDADALLELLLRRHDDGSHLGRAEQLRARHREQLDALKSGLPADPALAGAVDRLVQSMEKGYDKLNQRLMEQQKREAGQLRQDMELIAAGLHPNGLPQERVFNPIVPYLVNYGPDWIAPLLEHLSIDPAAGLQLIALAELTRISHQLRREIAEGLGDGGIRRREPDDGLLK
jgi:bacillithiol biosynthesis cysteine-adding enzyme BshC